MDFETFLARLQVIKIVEYVRMPHGKFATLVVLDYNGRQIAYHTRGHLAIEAGVAWADEPTRDRAIARLVAMELLDAVAYAHDFVRIHNRDLREWATYSSYYFNPARVSDEKIKRDIARFLARAPRVERWLGVALANMLAGATRP